ncbi:tRNA (adenosine(37)-N6)-threonylcarbamoyltransferase complex dimerization subunit type 1 TsaB [Chloroflexi bacterium TSY]|nr:tRNA (adenosine(37)-N6)-threonylcarbamoyltransferase complex dimerization subunit type 1 TsaB [Chloroflexi bacterium TSY]MBV7329352.1 tRNA (adenosine(37)-N6)-threonylcarbamoyltransferase complex dimerization subunit type 1 TsaB [Chloroflexi bacterium TSY]
MLLALDTATQTASIAIYHLETDTLLGEWTWQAQRRQTQDLLVTTQQLLQQLRLKPEQVTALAVTTGPGSFTGVRIAISAVKGIAIGLPHPPKVLGIPTLCVTAWPWLALALQSKLHKSENIILCPYIQAGRGRYNWLLSSVDSAESTFARPDAATHSVGTNEEFVTMLQSLQPSFVWAIGELTTELHGAIIDLEHVTIVDAVSGLRRAGNLARLAARYFAANIQDNLEDLQPLYLRSP